MLFYVVRKPYSTKASVLFFLEGVDVGSRCMANEIILIKMPLSDLSEFPFVPYVSQLKIISS
jgi:hypothetical protein